MKKKFVYFKMILIMSCLVFSSFTQGRELNKEELERLRFIENSFKKGEKHSKYWQWGYFGLYSGGAVFKLATHLGYKDPLTQEEKHKKFDALVDFGKSTIGSLGLWFRPIIGDRAYGQLKDMKDDKNKLDLAETLFTNTFKRVRGELSWIRRVSALGVNGLAALLIYNDGKRSKDALVNFSIGMVVSEIMIRTVPKRVLKDYPNYKQKFKIADQSQSFFKDVKLFAGVNSLHLSASF
ncbi:MAG: hypothetical protein CME68_12130 [Halobacteriovoraceae bacterium]|nr:hypothetical protein [Halobacteriovoraceae bacterium]|tara:strand:+ start:487 stop:1197 length:711 start_codon:yes stop_codon:yes gene_type:complete